MPPSFKRGRNGRSLLGAGEGGFPCPRTPLCKRIGIAIASLYQATVGRIDRFDLPLVRLDIKGAGFAHLHASYMDAPGLEFVRDDSPHPVAGLETLSPGLLHSREEPREDGNKKEPFAGMKGRNKFIST